MNANYLLDGLESERLRFRKLELRDYSVWLEFFKDPLSNKYWMSENSDPEFQCRQWFDKIFDRYNKHKGGMNVLIEKQSGKFVGQCGLLIQQVDNIQELEIGYSIMPEFRNQGYATEAAQRCLTHAFVNDLSKSVISIIHENNIESEKVALKLNMYLEKRTIYANNPVKIYRIKKSAWLGGAGNL